MTMPGWLVDYWQGWWAWQQWRWDHLWVSAGCVLLLLAIFGLSAGVRELWQRTR